jgi:hypothetical protein
MSLLYLKYQSRKNLPFPRIENLSKKNSFREFLSASRKKRGRIRWLDGPSQAPDVLLVGIGQAQEEFS